MGPGPLCLRTGSPYPGTQDGGDFCGGRSKWCGFERRNRVVKTCGEGCSGLAVKLQ
jgi:hypothetical protein